jgi:hypothetical protein
MKRVFAIVFVCLYFYNIVGYLVVFSVLQYRVRAEMKQRLKSDVPDAALTRLSFETRSLEEDIAGIRWIDRHEFTFQGKLFDIVHSTLVGDSTILLCINDTQEEQLFANLDTHVQREMGHSGEANKLDSFKDVFKESYSRCFSPEPLSATHAPFIIVPRSAYESIALDVPALPPKFIPRTS